LPFLQVGLRDKTGLHTELGQIRPK
jgi:hypothetical protein